jgi:hypothetical protein
MPLAVHQPAALQRPWSTEGAPITLTTSYSLYDHVAASQRMFRGSQTAAKFSYDRAVEVASRAAKHLSRPIAGLTALTDCQTTL